MKDIKWIRFGLSLHLIANIMKGPGRFPGAATNYEAITTEVTWVRFLKKELHRHDLKHWNALCALPLIEAYWYQGTSSYLPIYWYPNSGFLSLPFSPLSSLNRHDPEAGREYSSSRRRGSTQLETKGLHAEEGISNRRRFHFLFSFIRFSSHGRCSKLAMYRTKPGRH